MKKSIKSNDEFISLMKEWQKLEDASVASADEMIKNTKNPIIKMTMEMIRSDSQKHKILQQMLIDSMTKEAVHLTSDELAPLSAMLNKHMEAEAKSLALADSALENSKNFITRYILSYLIADETKHHALINKLNELKRATIFVT